MDRTAREVTWRASGDDRHPYVAHVDGETWQIRVAEFPEDAGPYALLVNGRPAEVLSEWPAAWSRPPAGGAHSSAAASAGAADAASPTDSDDHERGAYEAEMARFERSRGVRPSKLIARPQEPRRPAP